MSINITSVSKFDQECYNALVKRNLEEEPYFIPSFKLSSEGDKNYSVTKETIRIAAFDENILVGLLHGSAISKNTVCMDIAVVDEKYRQQGIYSRMLDLFLQMTKHYDEVMSSHHVFNNKIISLKLRKGFYIVGMDQSSFIGPRVQLKYFHNEKIFDVMKYRVGMLKHEDLPL